MATTIGQSFKVESYENIKTIYSHQLSLDYPFQCFHFFVDLKSKMTSTTGHFFYESMSLRIWIKMSSQKLQTCLNQAKDCYEYYQIYRLRLACICRWAGSFSELETDQVSGLSSFVVVSTLSNIFIDDKMVSVLTLIVVYCGFDPWSGLNQRQ